MTNSDSWERHQPAETRPHVDLPETGGLDNSGTANELAGKFGKYQIRHKLGQGGMGVVYLADDTELDRPVAIKIIRTGVSNQADQTRFRNEALAAAQLDHPGIVPVYEIGRENGIQFMAIGFVEGQNLAEAMAAGTIGPRQAAAIVRKLASAVSYAHSKNVLHRDIKPANVLIDENGEPKLTDFGLAKDLNSDATVTMTGEILGTPGYMSPEQATGVETSYASDVYSLGAVLYFLLTGRPPFLASSIIDTINQVVNDNPPPLKQLNPDVPRDLEQICLRCLKKNPGERYSSAAALADDLGRFIDGATVQVSNHSPIQSFANWLTSVERIRDWMILSIGVSLTFFWLLSLQINTHLQVFEENVKTAEKNFASANTNFEFFETVATSNQQSGQVRARLENLRRSESELGQPPETDPDRVLVDLLEEQLDEITSNTENLFKRNFELRLRSADQELSNAKSMLRYAQTRAGTQRNTSLIFTTVFLMAALLTIRDPNRIWIAVSAPGLILPGSIAILLLPAYTSSQPFNPAVVNAWLIYSIVLSMLILLSLTGYLRHKKHFQVRKALRGLGIGEAIVIKPCVTPIHWIGVAAGGVAGGFTAYAYFNFDLVLTSNGRLVLSFSFLAIGGLLAFLSLRIAASRIYKTQFGWKLQNGVGDIIELGENPNLKPMNLLEACIFSYSFGMMGGNAPSAANETIYYLASSGGRRYLIYSKELKKYVSDHPELLSKTVAGL